MIRNVWLGLLAAALCMSSWAADTVVSHDMGTTTLKAAPKRVVVLEFSFVDALASVGMPPVGIADDKNRERIVPELTEHIGDKWVSVGTRKQPSLEVIASLAPDLIIADKKRHSAIYDSLSEIAPTIVLDSLGSTYEENLKQMEVIAGALGKEKEMARRIARHQQVMDSYAARIDNKNAYTAQFGVANANGLWLHGPASYAASVLKRLGFESPVKETEKAYIATSLEQLAEVNPDILLVGEYTDPSFVDGFSDDALWKSLDSVNKGHYHNVTAHNWSRLRGLIAAEMVAEEFAALLDKQQ